MEQDRKPEISPFMYHQIICDKRGKTTQCWEDSLFNKWCWENWIATYFKNEIRSF